MADYDVEADLPALLEALRDRGDLVSVRAVEAIEHLQQKVAEQDRAWTDVFGVSTATERQTVEEPPGPPVTCALCPEPATGRWWASLPDRVLDLCDEHGNKAAKSEWELLGPIGGNDA